MKVFCNFDRTYHVIVSEDEVMDALLAMGYSCKGPMEDFVKGYTLAKLATPGPRLLEARKRVAINNARRALRRR